MTHTDRDSEDTSSDKETEARAEATLNRMLATPHKSHKDSKLGRGKAD